MQLNLLACLSPPNISAEHQTTVAWKKKRRTSKKKNLNEIHEFNVCFVFLSLRGETVKPRSHSNDRNYIEQASSKYLSMKTGFSFLFAALEAKGYEEKCNLKFRRRCPIAVASRDTMNRTVHSINSQTRLQRKECLNITFPRTHKIVSRFLFSFPYVSLHQQKKKTRSEFHIK